MEDGAPQAAGEAGQYALPIGGQWRLYDEDEINPGHAVTKNAEPAAMGSIRPERAKERRLRK